MNTQKHKFPLTLLSLIIGASLNTAVAQETTNEDEQEIEVINITGTVSRFGVTKSNTPIVETARSLSIETAEDFLEKGALNLSQTLTYMPGVTAETTGFSTRGDFASARGLRLPRYRDSIQELFGNYNTTRAEVYTLEQVEVLRGPASVMYGQGSPGGIVNYVTKTPRAETGRELFVQAGNFNRQQLGLDFTGTLSDDETLLGRFVGLVRNADTQVENVEDDTMVLMPSVTFMPSDATTLTLIGLYQDTNSDTAHQFIPIEGTLVPLTNGGFIDQDVYAGEPDFNKFDTKSSQVTFLAEHVFSDELVLHATALWRDGEADYHQAWATFTGAGASRYLNNIIGSPIATPTTVPRTFYQADNEFEQMALDIRLTGNVTTGSLEHNILAGVQYQDVETDNNLSFFQGGGVLQGDFTYVLDLANPVYTGAPPQAVFDSIYIDNPLIQVDDLGIYVSDEISFQQWRVTLGARYDSVDNNDGTFDQSDSQISLSAGALYAFDNGVSPYINYAESFETVVGITAEGTSPEPQEATQIEIGVKYEPKGFPGYFTLAWFDIDISNLPDPASLQNALVQLQGESDLSGFEFEGKFNIGEFDIQLAYATLDAQAPNGTALDSVPDGNASVWTTWTPESLPGFRLGAGIRYVGESVSELGTAANDLRYVTPDYTLGDIMIGYELSEKLDFALNIRNVSDKEYLTSCLTRGDCFPGLRRSINGTVTYRF